MRQIADRLMDALLRLTRWYHPAEIEKRERRTAAVTRAVERSADERRMSKLYQDRLVGRRS
jgi:hypothetical protein